MLQPDHDVVHWAVTDIGDCSRDGDDGGTVGGDHVRGHPIDADTDERRRLGLAGGGALRQDHQRDGEHPRKSGHDADHCGKTQ